jgi:hypothetical protein
MFHRSILLILFAAVFFSCGTPENKSLPDNALSPDLITNPATAGKEHGKVIPVITFDKSEHDFGSVVEGEKVTFSFHFKNTGNGDLIIRHAQASCGCTVPEWPKDPIAPGKDGYIGVTFNSDGKSGMIHKSVTIIANTIPNTTELVITGEVKNQ